jgi:hypothetical protein
MGIVCGVRRVWTLGLISTGCITPTTGDSTAVRVCETSRVASPGAIASLSVTATPIGAVAAWVAPSGVMAQRFADDGSLVEAPAIAWPGTFDATTVASVDDYVVLGAVAGNNTFVTSAPLGVAPYRELGLIGGIVGPSTMVVAGGEPITASVSWGGLLVNGFDNDWNVLTAQISVLTPNATEIAVTANAEQAMVVWPTSSACFFEQVFDTTHGSGWSDPGACTAPRLASTASNATLAFERDGGVYLSQAPIGQLHASNATRFVTGSSPRIAVVGETYWLSYLDATGAIVVGELDGAVGGSAASDAPGLYRSTSLGSADAFELVDIGGEPRVFAATGDALEISTLCAE